MVGKCNTNDGDDCREWQREPAPPPTTTPLILFLAVTAELSALSMSLHHPNKNTNIDYY